MPKPQRDSVLKMQAAIRQTRSDLGLPKEGPLRQQELLDALKQRPPIDKIVGFVKKSLGEDPPLEVRVREHYAHRPGFDNTHQYLLVLYLLLLLIRLLH